jgi:hypothetical protein
MFFTISFRISMQVFYYFPSYNIKVQQENVLEYYIKCSGYNYDDELKGPFYPENPANRYWLLYYSQIFEFMSGILCKFSIIPICIYQFSDIK